MITIDGGTGPRDHRRGRRSCRRRSTRTSRRSSDGPTSVRRLKVRANADNAGGLGEGARVRRAGDRPLPHRAHVLRRGAAARRAGDDPRRRRGGPPRRARPAAAVPAVRLRGDLRGDGRPAGDDPAARPAAARVPAAARGGGRRAHARSASARCGGEPDARHARLPARDPWPEIYEMQVRAIARAAQAVQERPATRRSSRSCIRSSASPRSCGGCAS